MEELNRLSNEEYRKAGKLNIQVVLDNVRSQNNIGSVFRTCDAFRIGKLYLCGITSTPPHREIHKTALGAEDTVVWEYCTDTLEAIRKLKAEEYRIFAAEQASRKIYLNEFPEYPGEKLAFVFGHEVRGVDQAVLDACDGCVEIPQFGTKHSLNISVSVGIVLWEAVRRRIETLE